MPEELQTEVHNIVQELMTKTIPKKKKCKEAKWLSEEALEIAEKWREVKSKGEKEGYSLGVSASTPKAQGLISGQERRFHKWFVMALSEIKTNIQK